jgi:hypothetical protein
MRRLDALEELLNTSTCSVVELCGELARMFEVAVTEIGLLRLDGQDLRFVVPAELQEAGSIPLSGSAIAARTAVGKIPELFNQFANVPHHNVFEKVRLQGGKDIDAPAPIQKLMSAPILNENNDTLGVVQVSRKGLTPAASGPDFTISDLEALQRAARRIAFLNPEILAANRKVSTVKLRFADGSGKNKA